MKNKISPLLIIIFSVIAFISSIILLLEKIELWKNPDYIPSCSWNPIFSCQGPMTSWQSSVFILPNPVLGILGFGILIILTGMTLFITMPKWWYNFWLGGITLATIFIGWLISQSLYDINALCVYCMIVWSCVIPMFWISIRHYLSLFYDKLKLTHYVKTLTFPVILVSYFIVIGMIYFQFESFFTTLIR